MSKTWHNIAAWGLPVVLAALTGCLGANNRTVRIAEKAEENGEAHVAYDAYCQAARQDAGDVRVTSALKRLAPTAAAYWDSQARISESKGEYGDAWRMAVKSLDIRPDQPGMADFARRLEAEHSDSVASAKQEWEKSGRVRVAAAAPSPTRTTVREEPRLAGAREIAPDETTVDEPAKQSQPPQPQPRQPAETFVAAAPAAPQAVSSPVQPRSNRTRQRRIYSAASSPRPAMSSDAGAPSEFMVMYTLSRREKGFPERLRLADGIYMKLRDVNGDRTADMDLDDGDDRVQKIRDMKEGNSKLFRGKSGRWYRITLVDVQERGETIRVGVRPG